MQLSQDECECAEPVRGGVRDADTPPPQVGGDPRQPDPTGACPALGAGAMVGPAQGEPPPAEEPGGVSAPPLDLVSRGAMYTTLGTPDWTYGTRHGKVLCGHVEVLGGTGLCSEPTGWPR